jgi:ankyrin repeat protein/nucleoside phosphorylase
VAGTCEWITHDKSYRAWLNSDGDNDSDNDGDGDGDTRLLWISGGPGKGKTMMSVFLTEELEKHVTRADNAEVAFFFCSAQDEKRNTAVAVLRGLVHQIIAKRPQLVKHVLPHFETPERTQQTLSSLEALWLIFSKLVADAEFGTMFCVLDGLDECHEDSLRAIVPRIVRLLTSKAPLSTKGTFKLAIVSRDIPGLQGCTRLRLDPDNDEKVASDIELFVFARVGELSRIEGFNEDFRVSVQTALLKRAEGTFLWVGFAMHELSQKQTCCEILEALKDLPSGLPAIYSRMLLRIPARQREVSQAILRWVALAARPLQLRELAAAVSIQATSSRMTVEQAVRDAVALCGPLLKVQDQELSLVHQSVRDYLLRGERDSDAVLEAFRLILEPSHLELAQKCLNCIARSDLQDKAIDLDTELDPQESPLLRYATLHWPEHARNCSILAGKLLETSGLFLQKDSYLRIHWWETYDHVATGYRRAPPPLLHIACSLGIVPWVAALLERERWLPRYYKRIDSRDNRGKTALHWAALKGNEAVVRLLVDNGADIKTKDKDGDTVLHRAAQKGSEAMVQVLVDRGADLDVKDNDGQTALHLASKRENESIARLLLDRRADIKAKDIFGQTVLHRAAQEGNKAAVRLLLDRGADVQAKDNFGQTALHSAVWGGNKEVVRLLVVCGADLAAMDRYGETALYSAVEKKNVAIIELLLDNGADVETKGGDGKTMLRWAAEEGNEAMVRLLVDKGTNVNAQSGGGHEQVVKTLLDAGADVNAQGEDYDNALQAASYGGHEQVVKMPLQLRRSDYTVGWVCALPVELAAAKAMLDEEHPDLERDPTDNDENLYALGSIGGHNVAIVCLPAGRIGNNPAASVATQMRATFKNIRFGLMVGIGGGVPSAEADIRLGDVVVSQPQRTFGGVVQYDFGRRTPNRLERIGSLNSPPQILLSAVSTVQANAMVSKSTLPDHLSTLERLPTFQRCRTGPDLLFKAAYDHDHGATCDQCSVESRQPRPKRESGAEVTIHYGTIASGNQVMKDAAERDRVSGELGGVLCFEMEAAGLMNSFPCLVIRGISDYADTHKNYQWQAHAAGTAAAYAKELLSVIPAAEVMNTRRVEDVMNGANS